MLRFIFMLKLSTFYFCLFILTGCGGDSAPNNTSTPSVNVQPLVNAGSDQNVDEQVHTTLAGEGSDSDGSISTYLWRQTAGTSVVLENPSNAFASFVAPLTTEELLLTFELEVTDNEGATARDSVDIHVLAVNAAPVSNAGTDQNVDEQVNTTLSGEGSDSDGSISTYQWRQTAGTSVVLENPSNAFASFVAPLTTEELLLTFELEVTDNEGATAKDSVDIHVLIVNAAPVSNAGTDQNVDEQVNTTLSGEGSDSDGSISTYQWRQTAGTSVVLENPSNASASFLAPLTTEELLLTFELEVTDNEGATTRDSVDIHVLAVNIAPVSNAGTDQNVDEQVNTTLSGEGSDSDGSISTYLWRQTAGTSVVLENPNNAFASFIAPLTTEELLLTFELEVTDNEGATAKDSVDIHVLAVNAAPVSNAGTDQNVDEQVNTTLSGEGSDSDGSISTYLWRQTAGTTVILENPSNASASFVAPSTTEELLLTFELEVTDNEGATTRDSVDIHVLAVNIAPISNAGSDQSVDEHINTTLAGEGSDSDGSISTYLWRQTAGTSVVLENPSNASASFVAPSTTEELLLTFELEVTDNEGVGASDSINITVTPVNDIQVVATNYSFGCSSQTQAVVWYDDIIAIVIEGEEALQFETAAMSRIVDFFHRLYDKYESITGLIDLPLDSPWQNRITIQIPLDNCGAGGLASHGVRGISVGMGEFERQYQHALNNDNSFMHVFFYESSRNFWLPEFNDYFDWAMNDEPMNWGWWTVGMNNAMVVIISDLLGVNMDYHWRDGNDGQWFRDRMVAYYETYRDNPIYDFNYGWRQEYMPWEPSESVNDLMSGLIIYSYETWGSEAWLKGFYQSIRNVPPRSDVFAYQESRDNIYRIWSAAAEEDLRRFFVDDLRWNLTSEGTNKIHLKYSLADVLAGGNGTFPGIGKSGTSIISSLNNHDFSSENSMVDGAFVPQQDGTTTISTSGISFDFSEKIGISLHDGLPSKGPFTHTDPSLQLNNLGTNPNYSGDPAHHAFIDMHATSGITYNLQKIKQSFSNTITLKKFTARFGTATGKNINYWVIVDGVAVKYGELINGDIEAHNVAIELDNDATYLTLVIGDANKGTINSAHGYIGDPILYGVGEKTVYPATATNPIDQSISTLAWQSLNWSYDLGVNNYDIYLWKNSETKPSTPNYNVTNTQLTPYNYLDFDTPYLWQITSNLEKESFTSPIYSFKVQANDQIIAPVYDISPAAQDIRTFSYTLNGLSQISDDNSNVSSGLTIGFYGDSNTDVVIWQQSLVNTLSTLGVTSLNRGINGADIQELWDGIRRYNSGGGLETPSPFVEQIVADNIDVAIIYIGINDVLNNNPNTPTATYKSYLNLMVEACIANNIKVVLVSPTLYKEKPDGSNIYDTQLDQYEIAVQEVAESRNVTFVSARTHFINYLKNNNFSIQVDGSVSFPYEINLLNYDAVHHNDTGKAFLSDLVADGLQRALKP